MAFFRRYQIYFWTTLSFLALLVVAALSLDTSFQARKKELIIQAKQHEFDNDPLIRRATQLGTRMAQTERYDDAAQDDLRRAYRDVLAANNIMYKITFTVGEGEPLVQEEDRLKYRRLNTLSNSLFSRRFSYYIYTPHRRGEEIVANTKSFYTSAPLAEVPGLAALLMQSRTIFGVLLIVVAYVYLLLLRKVLQPVTRVTTALEHSSRGPAVLIEGAGEPLELAYNQLARNTQVIEVSGELDDQAGQAPLAAKGVSDPILVFLRQALACIARVMGYRRVFILRESGQESRLRVDVEQCVGNEPTLLGEHLDAEAVDWPDAAREARLLYPEEMPPALRDLFGDDGPLVLIGMTLGGGLVGLVVIQGVLGRVLRPGDLPELVRVRDVLDNAMSKVQNRQLLLDRERSAITGTLSSNLGHDLTNIIATSRWDLTTVEQAVEMGLLRVESQRGAAALDALKGLANNMTLLQEVVNIYRAYGDAQRPVYEPLDVNQLVEAVRDLFQLSNSRALQLTLDPAADLPPCVAEPRLLKVALFNLLSNAARAVTQSEGDASTQGEIVLRTRRLDGDLLEIAVLDSGTGFRDEQGRLLEDWEIRKTLRYGYSTKPEGTGGLGLAWVRTIIGRYHQGRLELSNRPGGGAEVRLILAFQDDRRHSAESPPR